MKFKRVITFLLRTMVKGLMVLCPFYLTGYIIYFFLSRVDSIFLFSLPFTVKIFLSLLIFTFGYFSQKKFGQRFIRFLDSYIKKVPVVRSLYIFWGELCDSIFKDYSKFSKPVFVFMDDARTLCRVGFITQDDLSEIGLPGMVAVYLTLPYTFLGGDFIIRSKDFVRPMDMSSLDVIQFTFSGGAAIKLKEKL